MRKLKLVQGLLILSIFQSASVFAAESITVVTPDYPPYLDKSHDSGYLVELLRAVFATQGVEVAFDYLPMRRAKHNFRLKKQLMVLTLEDLDPEEKQGVRYVSLGLTPNYLLFLTKNTRISEAATFSGLTIGILRGSTDEVNVAEAFGANVEVYNSTEAGMKLLISGRIDAMQCLELRCQKIKKTVPDLMFDTRRVSDLTMSLLMHPLSDKKTREIFSGFSKGLEAFKNSGGMLRLQERYEFPLKDNDSRP